MPRYLEPCEPWRYGGGGGSAAPTSAALSSRADGKSTTGILIMATHYEMIRPLIFSINCAVTYHGLGRWGFSRVGRGSIICNVTAIRPGGDHFFILFFFGLPSLPFPSPKPEYIHFTKVIKQLASGSTWVRGCIGGGVCAVSLTNLSCVVLPGRSCYDPNNSRFFQGLGGSPAAPASSARRRRRLYLPGRCIAILWR